MKEKDVEVVNCVVNLVQHSERCTEMDRNRWILAHQIFSGEYQAGDQGEGEEEEAKVGLHTFSKICRGAASAAQELLHQDPRFYDFIPPGDEDMDIFGKTIEKIHRYRVDQLKIENHTYKFVLAGAISGLGINKFRVVKNLEDSEEYLLGLLAQEREKESKNISSEIRVTEVVGGDSERGLEQLGIADTLFSIEKPQRKKIPKKGSKNLSYKIGLKLVNPVNFYFDPSCEDLKESSWVAERYYLPMHKIEEGFKVGVFNKGKREELLQEMKGGLRSGTTALGSDFETQKFIFEDKNIEPNPYNPMVEIIEYYGPVLEKETGIATEEHQKIIIAGGKVLLHQGPNPDWKRRSPYFFSTTSFVPFKGLGAGIADNGVDQEIIGNTIMNLMLRHLEFNVKGVKAVDVSALDDASILERGFTPGDLVGVRADSRPVKDLFADIDYNPNLTYSVMQALEKLDLSAASAASVDTQGSNPSSRARISAAEIRSNSDRTSRSQFSLARELDETYLEELLRRVLDFVLQYDLENKALEEFVASGVISDAEYMYVSEIPVNERLREAKRGYRLNVKGFRERLERNEFLGRLSEYMQQVNMLVNVAPEIKDSLDFKQILKFFSEAYGLNTDKIIRQNTPSDQAREENLILSEDRQVEVIMNDDHSTHLTHHYDAAFKSQPEALINHIRMHIQIATQGGMGFPPVPPELEQLIYGPPEEAMTDEYSQSGGEAGALPPTFQ